MNRENDLVKYFAIANENRNNIEHYSTIETIDNLTNNKLSFYSQNKIDNLAIVKFLAIGIDKSIDISNFENLIVTIGEVEICNISFDMFYKLSTISFYEKERIITFPERFFTNECDKFLLYKHPEYKLTFSISGKHNLQYNLHLKCTYYLTYNHSRNDEYHSQSLRVKQINKEHSGILNINKINYRKFLYGFFVESKTEKIKEIIIESDFKDKKVIMQKYNYYALNSLLIFEHVWNKNKVFDIIMSRLLPPEMINHIASYIPNMYLYYIPIDMDNCKWNNKGPKNYMRFFPIIKFDKQYNGDIYSCSNKILEIKEEHIKYM